MKLSIKSWFAGPPSIRRQLFLILAGGALAVLLAMNAAWLPSTIQQIRDDEAELQRIAVLGLRGHLRTFLAGNAEDLTTEAALFYLPFQEQDIAELRNLASRFLKREASIEELSIIDNAGKEVVRVSRRETFSDEDLRDFSSAPLFKEAGARDIAWGPVQIGKWSEPWMAFAVPLKGLNAAPLGVVQAVTNLRPLWSWTRDFNLSKGGRAYVADQAGRLIAADDAGLVIKGLSFLDRPMIRQLAQTPDAGPMEFKQGNYQNEHGIAVMATALSLAGPDWVVAVEQPEALLYAPILRKLWFSLGLFLFGVIASFAFAHGFSSYLARPILHLRETVADFGKGQLDRRASVEAENEVGELARAFNHMAGELKSSYQNLEAILSERSRELGALYTAMTPPASSCSLEQMQQAAIERLVAVTGADMGRICVRTHGGHALKSSARHGYPAAACETGAQLGCDTVTEAVIASGEAVIASEISETAQTGCLPEDIGIRSRAVLPLTNGEEVTGVIDIASRQAGHFQPDKKAHLTALAHQMSIAIANVDLYEKLGIQARALEKANKLQADFTAMIAHDLRSPLNTVLGVNELMTDSTFGPVTDEQKKWLGKTSAIVRQLTSLVNDFLDVSKIEAGHIELSLAEVNLDDLLDSALENFHAQAVERKIALGKRIDPTVAPIRGDRRRLEQVLTNLLSNAIKFTPPGGAITVGARLVAGREAENVSRISYLVKGKAHLVSREAKDENVSRISYLVSREDEKRATPTEESAIGKRDTNNEIRTTPTDIRDTSDEIRSVEFSVQDTGVGIPASELGGLFEKYRQTSSGKTSEHKGTGLGLVICKMIVEAHGGKIWAESNEGGGATFRFTLPAGV